MGIYFVTWDREYIVLVLILLSVIEDGIAGQWCWISSEYDAQRFA